MGLLSWLFGDSSASPTPLDGDGEYSLQVVGESKYQHVLDRICGGKTEDGHEYECTATLEREPHNPHDANAIVVKIEGKPVGYVPRPAAKKLAPVIDRLGSVAQCDAMIRGGWDDGEGDSGHYGVVLDLEVPQ